MLLANNVDGKPVEDPLYIFVTFLFAEYGNDPPHEFTGSLLVARFTPTFRFETKNDSVLSVRVDYRFHFDLDSYLQNASFLTRAAEKLKKKMRGKENYALVLRDADSFPPSLIATVSESGNTGKDIVYWLSCKAQRIGKDVFKGTLLVNGFYFAHDEEKPFSLFRPANMFGPTEGVDLQKPIREKPYNKLFRGPFD